MEAKIMGLKIIIEMSPFFIFSRGACTIFLSGEAENTTFAIGRREQLTFSDSDRNFEHSWTTRAQSSSSLKKVDFPP